MIVGNLQLHQCIITTNLDILESYIYFEDENPFDLIDLNCALGEENRYLKMKLTALFTYKTCYKDVKTKPVLISSSLGKYIAVNTNIR